jgi:hypothetical protein
MKCSQINKNQMKAKICRKINKSLALPLPECKYYEAVANQTNEMQSNQIKSNESQNLP